MVGLCQSMEVLAEVIEDILVAEWVYGRALFSGLRLRVAPLNAHVGQPLPQVSQEQRQSYKQESV